MSGIELSINYIFEYKIIYLKNWPTFRSIIMSCNVCLHVFYRFFSFKKRTMRSSLRPTTARPGAPRPKLINEPEEAQSKFAFNILG